MRPPRRTMQPIGQQATEQAGGVPVEVPPVQLTPVTGVPLLRRPRASDPPRLGRADSPVFDTTEEEDLA